MRSLPWRRTRRTSTPARLTATALLGTSATVAALMASHVIPVPSWAIPGIDVASHQHPGGAAIDWNTVAASGQKFAFVKATEGTNYTNPYYASDSVKAQQAGIIPGSYHYARPGWNDPRAEARFYASVIATGPQPSLPPVLDLEEDQGLSPQELQHWVREWLDEIKIQTGRQPIIYTYYSFWKQKMANTTEFSEYPLWLAYYSNSLPGDIPGGWDEATFWQYSGNGSVDGVITDVDMNEYYGDDSQLQALAGDMGASTPAGETSNQLAPTQPIVEKEAQIVNEIEHQTGVNMPITSDFVVQLLGVVGGRVSPETFINSALPQLTGPVASAISQQLGVPQDQVAEKIQQGQELLPALTALAGALGEARQNGGVPTEAIQQLLNMAGESGALGSAGSSSTVDLGQLLRVIQTVAGTQDWAGQLQNGQLNVDPNAVQGLLRALS